jgi:hemerythrin-like domain-containing protein
LLVPVDGTDASIEAISYAVRLAREQRARVSFSDVHQHQKASRSEERLAKAESAARAQGVPCASLGANSTRREILATAQDTGCDVIVMAAQAYQTHKLNVDASVPVLICPSSAAQGVAARTIAAIRDDHRTLAAVLHAMLDFLSAGTDALMPHAALLPAGARFIQGFSVGVHHPKEEQHLFRKLRERTSLYDPELAELERQHLREVELIEELVQLADAESAGKYAQLRPAVERYASFLWEHHGREEGLILPAAQRHLRPEDWSDIEAALFAAGG